MLKLFIAQILQNSVDQNKSKTLVRKILFCTLEILRGSLVRHSDPIETGNTAK